MRRREIILSITGLELPLEYYKKPFSPRTYQRKNKGAGRRSCTGEDQHSTCPSTPNTETVISVGGRILSSQVIIMEGYFDSAGISVPSVPALFPFPGIAAGIFIVEVSVCL